MRCDCDEHLSFGLPTKGQNSFNPLFFIYEGNNIFLTAMDKKDIMYMISALAIILVIAVIIKPIATGKPINTGLALVQPTSSMTAIPQVVFTNITSQFPRTSAPSIMTTPPTPAPAPTWNQQVQTIGFVNPSSYQVNLSQSIPSGTNITSTVLNTSMTTYATISGNYSGTTQIINIPFPYWELRYTIDPATGPMGGSSAPPSIQITPTLGQGVSYSGVQGAYSTVTPVFSIQVMDAGDPNRIVRVVSPPGGIDPDLWLGITPTTMVVTRTPKYAVVAATTTPLTSMDPRPWTEKFYEGQRGYYFIITSQSIKSYTIWIRVPARYIGQY
jgi:hypothetical protein